MRADIHDGQELKRSINRPDTEAQDQLLQIIIFGLQRAAGPYRWANKRHHASYSIASSARVSSQLEYFPSSLVQWPADVPGIVPRLVIESVTDVCRNSGVVIHQSRSIYPYNV